MRTLGSAVWTVLRSLFSVKAKQVSVKQTWMEDFSTRFVQVEVARMYRATLQMFRNAYMISSEYHVTTRGGHNMEHSLGAVQKQHSFDFIDKRECNTGNTIDVSTKGKRDRVFWQYRSCQEEAVAWGL
jgi:hypothetical protein